MYWPIYLPLDADELVTRLHLRHLEVGLPLTRDVDTVGDLVLVHVVARAVTRAAVQQLELGIVADGVPAAGSLEFDVDALLNASAVSVSVQLAQVRRAVGQPHATKGDATVTESHCRGRRGAVRPHCRAQRRNDALHLRGGDLACASDGRV